MILYYCLFIYTHKNYTNTARPRDTRILVPEKNRAAQNPTYTYSDLPNNRAANLINFLGKKHLPTRLLGHLSLHFLFLRTEVNSRVLVTTTIQNLQRALIPQTSNWSGTIFCRFLQQTGSST
jgi:hypothetical protein